MIIDTCPPSSACRIVSSSVPYGLQSAKYTFDSRVNEAENVFDLLFHRLLLLTPDNIKA
jgi:hypothetical protein